MERGQVKKRASDRPSLRSSDGGYGIWTRKKKNNDSGEKEELS